MITWRHDNHAGINPVEPFLASFCALKTTQLRDQKEWMATLREFTKSPKEAFCADFVLGFSHITTNLLVPDL